jgi:hypothetical protein
MLTFTHLCKYMQANPTLITNPHILELAFIYYFFTKYITDTDAHTPHCKYMYAIYPTSWQITESW